MNKTTRHLVLTLTACAIVISLAVLAQKHPQESSRPTEPPTEALVGLELSMQDAPAVRLGVRPGELATYENLEHDYRVGIVPRVVDAAGGDVELQLFQVDGRDAEPRVVKLLESIRAKEGFSSITAASSALPLEIKLVELSLPETNKVSRHVSEGLESLGLGGPSDSTNMRNIDEGCCTTCGGETICGCAVGTSCGWCCGCDYCS